ncbi:hypothetical protein CAEBREN_03533 [Caenorhabditis brenneri]|uniref:Uncharacterized protein n=1 Tax=Caenorhabditis brenneri TaxID=135651 RepID=G0MTI9_CAEBE|nr:hypothetical protein CAEBREN_03533 [Caenorhabditis brenneri]
MLSSKVVFAVVASIALASAVPGPVNNLPIIGGGNGGGQGGSGGLLGGLLGAILGGDLLGELLDDVIEGGSLGELDTIFFMAQNLAKQQKGNGIAVSQESQNRIRIRP